jgi:hypothetical protein
MKMVSWAFIVQLIALSAFYGPKERALISLNVHCTLNVLTVWYVVEFV